MNKKFYILVLVAFGFLGMPNAVFACEEKKPDTHSCKRETTSTQDTKDCCDNQIDTNNKRHNGCGVCGNSNCNISVVQTAFFIPFLEEIVPKNELLYTQKGKFYTLETTLSSGFQSLWLIPKIG